MQLPLSYYSEILQEKLRQKPAEPSREARQEIVMEFKESDIAPRELPPAEPLQDYDFNEEVRKIKFL